MDSFSCKLFPVCSGCKCLTSVRNPLIWSKLLSFFHKINPSISLELVTKEITLWRSRVKLAVRGSKKKLQIGLFKEGSHLVVDMQECPLHNPFLDQALSFLRQSILFYEIEPYQEKTLSGRLRYIQMVVNVESKKIQLTLVWNGESLQEKEKVFIEHLMKKDIWHSVWANYLQKETNAIFGKKWDLLAGKEAFEQKVRGIFYTLHPSCFFQAHISLFEEMLAYIEKLVPSQKNVLELYAGVGVIGLQVAQKSSHVTFIESSPRSRWSFEKTLSKLPSFFLEKCSFLSSSVEEGPEDWMGFSVILVDPPRKGLSKKCKERIFSSGASSLVYISCGPDSFMRDCLEFLEKGWALQEAKGFLLFPGSDHVEMVALFQRPKPF